MYYCDKCGSDSRYHMCGGVAILPVPTAREVDAHEETLRLAIILEKVAATYGKHNGPSSDEKERRIFASDLHRAALRYARTYYMEARELGLIPEYEVKKS